MTKAIEKLVRPEVLNLKPYVPAKSIQDAVRLNANESPYCVTEQAKKDGLNLYPDAVPIRIRERISQYLDVDENNCVITRGSTEAIDVLLRVFCQPNIDEIIIFPPTFEMYQFYAAIQGVSIKSIPLLETNNYEINLELLGRELCTQSKLIFLSSPSNPIGHTISKDTIFKACETAKDFGLLVLDLAYIEFADEDFTKEVLSAYSNVVVLRTLSKAFGLAGSRCGVLLASSEITNYVMRVLPPYSFSKPAEQSILEALTEDGIETSKLNINEIIKERIYLEEAFISIGCIKKIYQSNANFILVEVENADQFCDKAKEYGLLLRNVGYQPTLSNCVRITVGTREQNDLLIKGIKTL